MLSRGGKNSLYAAVLPVLLEMGEIPSEGWGERFSDRCEKCGLDGMALV
jgi:hypothetical protein